MGKLDITGKIVIEKIDYNDIQVDYIKKTITIPKFGEDMVLCSK